MTSAFKARCHYRPAALLLFTCLSMPGLSQSGTVSIEKFCDAQHVAKGFNGNVLVAQNGKVLFQKSYGYADRHAKKQLTASSLFNICSITKEFTAAAVMVCAENRLLSLGDSLTKFFPGLPYGNVTLRQMLNHSSGLISSEFLFKELQASAINNDNVVCLLEKRKPGLLFTPGTAFSYSNVAYMLLAKIIENVSGTSYAAFLQQHIFDRLQMRSTYLFQPSAPGAQNTKNYIYDFLSDTATEKTYFEPGQRADWARATLLNTTYGNGNLFSTTGDLLKWQTGLANGKVVRNESYRQMLGNAVPANFAGIESYGSGLSINHVYGDTLVFHNGGTLGYSTTLRYFTNKDIVIITLANTNRDNDPADAIAALLYGKEAVPASPDKKIKLRRNQLEAFTGTYELGGRQFKIALRNDSLFRVVEKAPDLELIPKAANRLYYADGSERELLFRKAGNKTYAYLVRNGIPLELIKR